MSITYDPTTPTGFIRLKISDKDGALFSDEEIAVLLAAEGSVVLRGIAACLETIASNQVLLLKVVTTGDITTDGAKVAVELRAQAYGYRVQAAAALAAATVTTSSVQPTVTVRARAVW